jgi:hypothetical protein
MARYCTLFSFVMCLGLVIVLSACTRTKDRADEIVSKAIETYGSDAFGNSVIAFDFRDRHYIARRKNGAFSYERIFTEGTDTVHDILTNNGFQRLINKEPVAVADTMAAKYARSVNSVIYFASLPYPLNDEAVQKKYLGETIIEGEPYYKIEVTFRQEGGGEDYEDVFHYWFHQQTYALNYLAYQYATDGGGLRFRKCILQHRINGIVLQDYINYKPKDEAVQFSALEDLYKEGALQELSRIELKNISVSAN